MTKKILSSPIALVHVPLTLGPQQLLRWSSFANTRFCITVDGDVDLDDDAGNFNGAANDEGDEVRGQAQADTTITNTPKLFGFL